VRFTKALVAATALIVVALTGRSSAQSPGGRFVAGEVIVKFRPDTNANAKADAHRNGRGTETAEIRRTNVQRVRVAAGDEAAAIARYRRNPNVEYAEPNYVRRLPVLIADGGPQVVPRDFYFREQWALHNTGQQFYCVAWIFGGELCLYGGTADADIDAPEAWSISQGNPAVTVAVIDSGIDYTHPDLAPNYAGGDDFVFLDGDPMDDHGHGTHVAGTIAAAIDNLTGNPAEAEGVTGVAPRARIRAYKVCRSDGTCDDFAIQQAIARAVVDGANVINMSLGESEYSQSLNAAVQDAWQAGVVIVAGAGNDGNTNRFYPAAFDNVVSVAAFDENHGRPSFSNYGSWVDISAPGNIIMSTYPMAACGNTTTPGDTGCYAWNTGTSMATPHVAGAAALIWSRSDVTSNAQVVDILFHSADRGGASNVRLDSWTIHGGLNLHDAISYGLTNLPPDADAGPDQTVADSDRDGAALVMLDGRGSSDSDGTIAGYVWRDGTNPIGTGETSPVWLSVGRHTLTLEVTDDDGDTAADTVVITVTPANQVTVTASTPRGTEAGTTPGVFTMARTGDVSVPLNVRYSVGGTAVAGTDYLALSGTATFQAGSSTSNVVVTPIDDGGFENDESVILTLSADAAYGLGSPNTSTVTIVSDDLPPDLAVTAMTAPAKGGADSDVVVTETTRNQGTGASLPSRTGFYLSANISLDAADTWLGDRTIPSLGPGITAQASTTLRIPASMPVGAYRILAKADWDDAITESSETNNVRIGSVIQIGPDLVVSALTAPAVAVAGGAISVSDTTKNEGGGTGGASATRFYWSTNTSLDASDQVIGSRAVGSLAVGASSSSSATFTVPTSTAAGSYYLIAQADGSGGVPETTEANNIRASAAIKVGPDLVVTAVSVPSSGTAGATLAATDSTRNQGAGPAAASSTGFYLSVNTTISPDDRFIGSRSVGELTAGGASTGQAFLQVPADVLPGSYYVVARADWNGTVAEPTETNNDRYSGVIRIGGDLVLTSVVASTPVMAGGPITVTETTRNQGSAPVGESTTAFYLSIDLFYDGSDRFLGDRSVGALTPSQTSTAQTSLVVPAGTAAGRYYIIGVADANGAILESQETNNTRYSGLVNVGPDLTVTALTGPSSAVAGTSISVTVTTRNEGGDIAPVSMTRFYLSSNNSLDAADQLLGARAVSSLGPELSDAGLVLLPIPASTAAGIYYIIAKGDGDDAIQESLETNNLRSRTISIATP
jgi:subtilisin family serine protease/subtilase family serine protease